MESSTVNPDGSVQVTVVVELRCSSNEHTTRSPAVVPVSDTVHEVTLLAVPVAEESTDTDGDATLVWNSPREHRSPPEPEVNTALVMPPVLLAGGRYHTSVRDAVPLDTCVACTHPVGPENWVFPVFDPRHATSRFPDVDPAGRVPVTVPPVPVATAADFCTKVQVTAAPLRWQSPSARPEDRRPQPDPGHGALVQQLRQLPRRCDRAGTVAHLHVNIDGSAVAAGRAAGGGDHFRA